jgi:N12 class adenine-specific DNA methylase
MCDTDRRLFVSSWYVHHPDLLIGRMGLKSNGFGPANAAIFDGDVSSALTERVARLPEDVYLPRAVENLLSMPRDTLSRCTGVRQARRVLPDPGWPPGHLGRRCVAGHRRDGINGARRIRGLMAIRDAARRLLHLQPVTADDGRLGEHRAALNTAYDTFVAQHGILHAKVNKRAFKGDPDLPLLLSLEDFDRESGTAEKADIFSRRTVGAVRKVERCSSADEALLVSLHEADASIRR